MAKSKKGKLIVFSGIDGSGKATQTKLLAKRLKSKGYQIKIIDFPQYGKKSAGLVEEYLLGHYGPLDQVSPYQASIFYACDRYAASFQINRWLKKGFIVLVDRYVSANLGHQGAKIKNQKKREAFFRWVYELEYKIFKIPKPTICFLLKTSPAISQKLIGRGYSRDKVKKRSLYLGKRKKDIHEKNFSHLELAQKSYLHAAQFFKREFVVIECVKDNQLLPPQEIHKMIWEKIIKRKIVNK